MTKIALDLKGKCTDLSKTETGNTYIHIYMYIYIYIYIYIKSVHLIHIICNNQFRWIIDLNVNYKIIEFFEVNTGGYLNDLGLGKDYLNWTQKALKIKENILKLNYIKIIIFCSTPMNQTTPITVKLQSENCV